MLAFLILLEKFQGFEELYTRNHKNQIYIRNILLLINHSILVTIRVFSKLKSTVLKRCCQGFYGQINLGNKEFQHVSLLRNSLSALI